MSKYSRLSVFGVLLAVAVVSLVGCVLKPGNNDSSSAPPSILVQDTTDKYFGTNGLLVNPISFTSTGASGSVTFNHNTHVSNAKLACSQCHGTASDSFPMGTYTAGSVSIRAKAASKSIPGGMQSLYDGYYCGKCHNAANGDAFDVKGNCSKCHVTSSGTSAIPSSGPEVTFKSSNVLFSHTAHVTNFKMTCNQCHQNNTPWAMSYKEQAYTMADLYAGKGCGICHKTGGIAFDCNIQVSAEGDWKSANCERCHGDVHTLVSSTDVGTGSCVLCHSGQGKEFDESEHGYGENGNAGNTKWFLTRSSAQAGQRCVECHQHEGMPLRATSTSANFSANMMATSMAANHAMACQTCHYPNLQVSGSKDNQFRLRESGDKLCGSCHHFRYGYSEFPVIETVFPTTLTSGIYTLASSSTLLTTTPAPFPIVMSVIFGINPSTIATTSLAAATLASHTINLTNVAANTWFTPHDGSGQYEVIHGNDMNGTSGGLSSMFIRFSRDIKGNLLTYSDSNNGKNPESCIKCHMIGDQKTTFGHTFKADETMRATFSTKQTEIDTLLETLRKKLKAAGGTGSPAYFPGATSLGADYNKLVTLGVGVQARIIFMQAYWNWAFLNNCNTPAAANEVTPTPNPAIHILAVHNYEFVKDLLTNTNTILDQLKDGGWLGAPASVWF